MQVSEATFQAERASGLGGSDIGALLGLNPWKSKHRLYLEKVGEVSPEPAGPPAQRGVFLEPIIRQWYADTTQRQVSQIETVVRHPAHPEFIGHFDGVVRDEQGRDGVLELKAPGIRNYAKWRIGGLPAMYAVQVQWYLGMLPSYHFGSMAFFSAEHWDGIHFDVPRDDELIELLQARAYEFWHEHVIPRVPPPPEDRPDAALTEALEAADQATLTRREDPAWAALMAEYDEAKELVEAGETLMEAVTERIKQEVGSAPVVEGAGHRVWWKARPGARSFKKDRLAAAAPLDRELTRRFFLEAFPGAQTQIEESIASGVLDLDLEQFHVEGKPSRPFRVVKLGGAS